MTPLAAVAGGLLAGAVGTASMDTVRYLMHRRAGGKESPLAWEFPPVDTWEQAPDPVQVAKRVIEGFTKRMLPGRWAAVWATGYMVLPEAGLYKPIWEYDAKTLASDLSAHLAYGAGTGTTFWLLAKIWQRAGRSM